MIRRFSRSKVNIAIGDKNSLIIQHVKDKKIIKKIKYNNVFSLKNNLNRKQEVEIIFNIMQNLKIEWEKYEEDNKEYYNENGEKYNFYLENGQTIEVFSKSYKNSIIKTGLEYTDKNSYFENDVDQFNYDIKNKKKLKKKKMKESKIVFNLIEFEKLGDLLNKSVKKNKNGYYIEHDNIQILCNLKNDKTGFDIGVMLCDNQGNELFTNTDIIKVYNYLKNNEYIKESIIKTFKQFLNESTTYEKIPTNSILSKKELSSVLRLIYAINEAFEVDGGNHKDGYDDFRSLGELTEKSEVIKNYGESFWNDVLTVSNLDDNEVERIFNLFYLSVGSFWLEDNGNKEGELVVNIVKDIKAKVNNKQTRDWQYLYFYGRGGEQNKNRERLKNYKVRYN